LERRFLTVGSPGPIERGEVSLVHHQQIVALLWSPIKLIAIPDSGASPEALLKLNYRYCGPQARTPFVFEVLHGSSLKGI